MIESASKFVSNVSKQENCRNCNKSEFVALNLLISCDMCNLRFCKKCLNKAKSIPTELIKHSQQVNQKYYSICKSQCNVIIINYYMSKHKDEMKAKYDEFLMTYFQNNEEFQPNFYTIPVNSPEDTTYRKALRFARVAEVASVVSGYSMTFNAIKYLYYGSEIVNKLIAGDLLSVLGPLIEALRVFDVKGPTGVLNLYYLSCSHVLNSKSNPFHQELRHRNGLGVLLDHCPLKLLDFAGNYLCAAQWLYCSSSLPSPHDDNEWGAWYLSRLVSRQKWTVIACVHDTLKLPDSSKSPAFALFIRKSPKINVKKPFYTIESEKLPEDFIKFIHEDEDDEDLYDKEAILSIRGSKSSMDWSINLNEDADPFIYYAVSDKNNLIEVSGFVHRGMYTSARAILDAFAMRSYLTTLSLNGYKVSIVGHSLGYSRMIDLIC